MLYEWCRISVYDEKWRPKGQVLSVEEPDSEWIKGAIEAKGGTKATVDRLYEVGDLPFEK